MCWVLHEIILNNPKLPIWIAGDFNLPNIDWDNLSVSGYNYSLQLCNITLDFIPDSGLTQIVNSSTRENNILDIFLKIIPRWLMIAICCLELVQGRSHQNLSSQVEIMITSFILIMISKSMVNCCAQHGKHTKILSMQS